MKSKIEKFVEMFGESKLYDPEQLPLTTAYWIKLFKYEQFLEEERQKSTSLKVQDENNQTT